MKKSDVLQRCKYGTTKPSQQLIEKHWEKPVLSIMWTKNEIRRNCMSLTRSKERESKQAYKII